MKSILILGGYGNTGKIIAQRLLERTNVELVLAGRNQEKATELANVLNSDYPGKRVSGISLDVANSSLLSETFAKVNMVLVASSTAKFTEKIADACIEAKVDYLDIQVSKNKIKILKSKEEQIKKSNLCFITDGGFHPGLPAVMLRYAALQMDELYTGIVGSVIQIDWRNLEFSESTGEELMEELGSFDKTEVFRDGEWKKINLWSTKDFVKMDFGNEFGIRNCSPMELEEIREVSRTIKGLKNAGFYVGGFNPIVDWIILPFALLSLKIYPRGIKKMADIMLWGLKKFSSPPFGTLLKLQAEGIKDGKLKEIELTISHKNGYELTAIPVVACVLQWLAGSAKKSGLQFQANLVEPIRFFRDMESMGVGIK